MPDNQRLSHLIREVFVLRLWHSSQNHSWVGEIQHVRSGRIMHLRNQAELLAYLETQMESADSSPSNGDETYDSQGRSTPAP